MSDSKEFEAGVLVKAGVGGLVAVVVSAARSYNMPEELVLAALGVAPAMIDVVKEAHARTFLARSEALAVGMSAAFDGDAERTLAGVRDANDKTDTVMFTTYRNMMDAIDDAVAPALGMLAGEYIYGKKPADAFFRGFGRMLCELNGEALDELRTCLGWAVKSSEERVPLHEPHGENEPFVVGPSNWALKGLRQVQHIFHLLKTNGLATEPPRPRSSGGTFLRQSQNFPPPPTPWAFLARETAARMLRIIGGRASGDSHRTNRT